VGWYWGSALIRWIRMGVTSRIDWFWTSLRRGKTKKLREKAEEWVVAVEKA
jgi:hypothetical protein